MLPKAGDINCLDGENNVVLLFQDRKAANTTTPVS